MGEMVCRVCGWWPPVVRVRKGTTEPASDAWRWRQLIFHVEDTAGAEFRDGRPDGPHIALSYGAVTDGTRALTINRAVLAPLLALMTGDVVDGALAGPEEMLRFRGEGWRAALMPVRTGVETIGPALELARV